MEEEIGYQEDIKKLSEVLRKTTVPDGKTDEIAYQLIENIALRTPDLDVSTYVDQFENAVEHDCNSEEEVDFYNKIQKLGEDYWIRNLDEKTWAALDIHIIEEEGWQEILDRTAS